MQQRILIIEDDPDIGALLQLHARDCDAQVRLEASGSRGLLAAQNGQWDLIVLDWLLPGVDGVTVCRRLRTNNYNYPILMLTARAAEADHVLGLDAGADDYVSKPFSVAELKARVRAQLRRALVMRSNSSDHAETQCPVRSGDFVLDPSAHTVYCHDRKVSLTLREFRLLMHFARHPSRTFTRQQLLTAVWGDAFEGYDHTVNSHINRLRAKIEHDPARPVHLVTVWGVGYRFDVPGLQ